MKVGVGAWEDVGAACIPNIKDFVAVVPDELVSGLEDSEAGVLDFGSPGRQGGAQSLAACVSHQVVVKHKLQLHLMKTDLHWPWATRNTFFKCRNSGKN